MDQSLDSSDSLMLGSWNLTWVGSVAIGCFPMNSIMVSKFQKHNLLFSFEPKYERNYFLISALASKMGQIYKMKAPYYIK